MSHERLHVDTEYAIKGEHISLSFDDIQKFNTHLQPGKNMRQIASFTRDEQELPRPIEFTSMRIGGPLASHSTPHMDSDIYFDVPNNINAWGGHEDRATKQRWQQLLLEEISEQLMHHDTGHTLPQQNALIRTDHDALTTLYARLSSELYAHIQTSSVRGSSNVLIGTIDLDTLNRQLSEPIKPIPEEPRQPYEQLERFLTVYTRTLDSIASLHSVHAPRDDSPTLSHHYRIAIEPSNETWAMPKAEESVRIHEPFDSISGMHAVKSELMDIATIMQDPDAARMYDVVADSFILHGPPGTGKTSLVRALADKTGAVLREHPSTAVLTSLLGESAKNAELIFDDAIDTYEQSRKPIILFFDEVDSLLDTTSAHRERLDVIDVFKRRISQLRENYANGIIVAGATNKDVYSFDDAVIRPGRLRPIKVPLPGLEERAEIWTTVLANSIERFDEYKDLAVQGDHIEGGRFMPYASDINPLDLARLTDERAGADFVQALDQARCRAYMQYVRSDRKEAPRINQALLIEEIRKLR